MPRRRNSQPSARPSGRMTANSRMRLTQPFARLLGRHPDVEDVDDGEEQGAPDERRSLTEVAQPGGQGEAPEERLLADGRDDGRRQHDRQGLGRAVGIGQGLGRRRPGGCSPAAPPQTRTPRVTGTITRTATPTSRSALPEHARRTRRPAHRRPRQGAARAPRTARCTRGTRSATTSSPSRKPSGWSGSTRPERAEDAPRRAC